MGSSSHIRLLLHSGLTCTKTSRPSRHCCRSLSVLPSLFQIRHNFSEQFLLNRRTPSVSGSRAVFDPFIFSPLSPHINVFHLPRVVEQDITCTSCIVTDLPVVVFLSSTWYRVDVSKISQSRSPYSEPRNTFSPFAPLYSHPTSPTQIIFKFTFNLTFLTGNPAHAYTNRS